MIRKWPFLFLLLTWSCARHLQAQTVRKVGCGEYARYVLKAADSLVYVDFWNGRTVALTAVNTHGKKIVDISGGLYSAVGVDAEGYAWVFGQGHTDAIYVNKDSSGAPFTGNISCTGYFGTYTTLKADGSIWTWGSDAWGLFSPDRKANLSKPVRLKMPPGVKFSKIRAGQALMALATNGDVYAYLEHNGIPQKIPLPHPASDIAASHTGFFIAIVPDDIKKSRMGWPYGVGAESLFFGVPGPLPGPVPLKKVWGITVPIRRIVANHNVIHFIDSLGRMFGLGDNVIGEVGNGEELVNHADIYHPPKYAGRPYAWDWGKHENLVPKPVQIGKGITWKDVWADNSYAFYHYAVDINDSVYFWGRSKSWVNGQAHDGEDIVPNAFDVLSPAMLHVFTTPNKGFGKFILYTCNAGQDQSITRDSTTLSGHATPSSGYTIASYKWTQLSGPSCTLTDPDSAKTAVKKMKTPGTYMFKFLMTDNNTGTISDTVAVKVYPPGTKIPPDSSDRGKTSSNKQR